MLNRIEIWMLQFSTWEMIWISLFLLCAAILTIGIINYLCHNRKALRRTILTLTKPSKCTEPTEVFDAEWMDEEAYNE